jgi:Ca-activated chloride channel family protein
MENRRRSVVIVAIVAIIIVILLLLWRCKPVEPVATAAPPEVAAPAATPEAPAASAPAAVTPTPAGPAEVLSPATVEAPAEIGAGAKFEVTWTGPANEGDYLTIVAAGAPTGSYGAYTLTREGSPLKLTAPIDAGECEVRYVAAQSRTVLGSARVTVVAAEATLVAADSITLDTPLSVEWTGPDNAGDFITIVAAGTRDGDHGNYTLTNNGSPLKITTLPDAGPAELRYMSGQGRRVLARKSVTITTPDVSLDAAAQAVAGAAVPVSWKGPGNQGDYLTVVAAGTPDGQYGHYTTVNKGATVDVTMPIDPGACELRYMTGRGARVLARKPILVVAAVVTLDAPATAAPGSVVSIAWTGPANSGDYITIVPAGNADGTFGQYTQTSRGSPLTVKAPAAAGDAEIRYISGQGARTLARRAIRIAE